jgi:hypothetical protein
MRLKTSALTSRLPPSQGHESVFSRYAVSARAAFILAAAVEEAPFTSITCYLRHMLQLTHLFSGIPYPTPSTLQ